MSSDDKIVAMGKVIAEHRGGLFDIDLEISGRTVRVVARRAGRMFMHQIRLVPGDQVEVEVSPYDMTRGRITYRGRREPRTTP